MTNTDMTQKTFVQMKWTDVFSKIVDSTNKELSENVGFILYALIFHESNKLRIKKHISWNQFKKIAERPDVIPSVRERHVLSAVGKLIERNHPFYNALIKFKPSLLKLLVRFPNEIQNEIVHLEFHAIESNGKGPSLLNYTEFRYLALKLCREYGISYRRHPTTRKTN